MLWLIFFYVIKRLFFKDKASQNQVRTVVYGYAFYGSFLVVGLFLLVLLSSYDIVTCLIILLGFFFLKALGPSRSFDKTEWVRKQKIWLIKVIENVEDKDPIIDIHDEQTGKRLMINDELITVGLIGAVVVLVSFYLIPYDDYQLSPSWFQELTLIKGLTQQQWFNEEMILTGQYALMNFYALMTGISMEMALESFGILQALVLCSIVFWFMSAITTSQITIPLISALLFGIFFNLAPIHLTQLTHAKTTWMALTFALPALIFISKPWMLYKRKKKAYFTAMSIIFLAIGLINLYILLILIPPFILIQWIFSQNVHRTYVLKSLLAWTLSTSFVLIIYGLSCVYYGIDFGLFLRTNLLSVSTTTSKVNMLLEYDVLLKSIQAVSLFVLIVKFFLWRMNKKKWAASMVFLLYINVLILLTLLDLSYLDGDMFNEVSPVFLACALGLLFHLVFYFFNKTVTRLEIRDYVSIPLIFSTLLMVAYVTQPALIDREQLQSSFNIEVIDAYEQIDEEYMPMSYAVVNTNDLIPLSVNSHQFITYDDFLTEYNYRDSVFFAHKNDLAFLKANNEIIVPNSLLVFVYKAVQSEYLHIDLPLVDGVKRNIELLQARGREGRIIYTSAYFDVYEIINTPNASLISEML